MIDRRNMLQGMAADFGAAVGASLLSKPVLASNSESGGPKRVVFFSAESEIRSQNPFAV